MIFNFSSPSFQDDLNLELFRSFQVLSEISESPKILDSLKLGEFERLKDILKITKEIFKYRGSKETLRIEQEIHKSS